MSRLPISRLGAFGTKELLLSCCVPNLFQKKTNVRCNNRCFSCFPPPFFCFSFYHINNIIYMELPMG